LLPVEPSGYHDFYRAPGRPWWWSLITIGGAGLALALSVVVILVGGLMLGLDLGLDQPDVTTVDMFLLNNVSLAAWLPLVVLVSWLVYRQGWGWLSSVTGRMRWRWLALSAGLAAVLLIGQSALDFALVGWPELAAGPDTVVLLVGLLLTTPLQAAAEEYATRGLLSRAVAALWPRRRVGLVLAWLVSSAVFMGLHMSSDLWLNLYYFGVASGLWWVTQRSGGLEAAVAYHVLNNLISEAVLPWSDLSRIFDREAGVGSPWTLLSLVWLAVYVAAVEYASRRLKLVRQAAPGAVQAMAAPTAGGPGSGPVPVAPGSFVPAPYGPGSFAPAPAGPGSFAPAPYGSGSFAPVPPGPGSFVPVPPGHAWSAPVPPGFGSFVPASSGPGSFVPVPPGPGWSVPVPSGPGSFSPTPTSFDPPAGGPDGPGSGARPDGQFDQSDQGRSDAQLGHPGFDQTRGQFGAAGDVAADGHRPA
jgi:membrane protease YdiL (CAAX protease family)